MASFVSNICPKPDKVLTDIADYASRFEIRSREAYSTAQRRFRVARFDASRVLC